MQGVRKHLHWLLTAYVAVIFIQSLFFKFTGSPETVYIFQGKLDPWAASLGFPGVFAPGGIFSAKVVGSFELIASVLLLAGAFLSSQRAVQVLDEVLAKTPDHADATRLRTAYAERIEHRREPGIDERLHQRRLGRTEMPMRIGRSSRWPNSRIMVWDAMP
mgnify:CR=1 FL=1